MYGSSAGAINGAYFLAGQAALGTTIYSEDINNAQFIDLGAPLSGRPIVDLGFLLDDVVERRKPLDVDSRARLAVAADRDGHGRRRAQAAVALRGFRDDRDLFAALRAGATMPVIAGPPVD